MQIIDEESFRYHLRKQSIVEAYQIARQSLGTEKLKPAYLIDLLEIPPSMCFALEVLHYNAETEPKADALDSIPLFSLLKGLYLPLSSMAPVKIANLFRLRWMEQKNDSKELLTKFLGRDLGLTMREKIGFLMGDPFYGKPSQTGQDTLLRVLTTMRLTSPEKLRDRLARVGDIGLLFAEVTDKVKSDPPIGAREAFFILRGLPHIGFRRKKDILRDLFSRAGRLESYFLARLILRRLNFGYEYRRQLVSRALSMHYDLPESTIDNAIALADIFKVTKILQNEGEQGLKKLVLKPLNPVSPALAGTTEVTKKSSFPMWVECKYDGIRLMLHKETSLKGRSKYAAFTRRKYDWMDMVMSLETSLNYLSALSFIIDGELHGKVGDWEGRGMRQATVYEIYRHLQGDNSEYIRLQYVAFDILYLNGMDLTTMPFVQRRKILETLVSPIAPLNLPVPLILSEGWEASTYQEFQKWYQYFLNQGHEGALAKLPASTYAMGKRTADWLKKKEAIYLDLAITGALWATSQRGPQTFSTYLLSCRHEHGFMQIGRAQGLERGNNFEIIQRIAMESLITGNMVEERTSSGIHSGIELAPSIVATVRFENITRNQEGVFSLRDPKIVYIRPRGDLNVDDVDSYQIIRQLYMKGRLQ